MIIKATKTEIDKIITKLNDNITKKSNKPIIKFLDLGTHKVRLLIYHKEFVGHIEKQMSFVLRDNLDNYDASLVLWKENNIRSFPTSLSEKFSLRTNFKLRLEFLTGKKYFVEIVDDTKSMTPPMFSATFGENTIEIRDSLTNTYYYGVEDLSPEEFIKEGHLFVQFINTIIKSKNTNIVHGAVVGFNSNGVLFCARGQRGKSTLTVLSLIEGFDFVSDDYLILEKKDDELFSYPIYSIITLSPEMYTELYEKLDGTRFVSNNARKDKYVINIKNFHNQFKIRYPIKICIFPEIVNEDTPSIKLCSNEEKGRAITQLIQSTVSQMRDVNDKNTIKKLYSMVKNFNFYRFNLCPDIHLNTEFLRDFLSNLKIEKPELINEDNLFIDITFDIANFLDPKTGTLYQMNHFATAVYESLLSGASRDEILKIINKLGGVSSSIEKDLDILIKEIKKKGLLRDLASFTAAPNYDIERIKGDKFNLSFREFCLDKKNIELLNKGE